MTPRFKSISTAAVALIATGWAGAMLAASISVPNAGFEERATFGPFGDGERKLLQPPLESWCYYEGYANGGPGTLVNPARSGLETAAEGDYIVYTVTDPRPYVTAIGPTAGVATLLEEESFDASKSYVLTAQVARYHEDDAYWNGYVVRLVAGGTKVLGGQTYAGTVSGGTVIAEDWNTQTVPLAADPTDEWVTSTVTYAPDPEDADLAGLPPQIRLLAIRDPDDPAFQGETNFDYLRYAAFDAVTLEVVIPEPSTAIMAGLGLAGLSLRRRRR